SMWFLGSVYSEQLFYRRPVHFHTPTQMGTAEKAAYGSVVRQLIERWPDLLLFRRTSAPARYLGDHYDVFSYLSQSTELRDRLGACYERIEADPIFLAFRLRTPNCGEFRRSGGQPRSSVDPQARVR